MEFSHDFFNLPTANRLKWWHKHKHSNFKWSSERIMEARVVYKVCILIIHGVIWHVK